MSGSKGFDSKVAALGILCIMMLIKDVFCLVMANNVPEYIQCVKETYTELNQVLPKGTN